MLPSPSGRARRPVRAPASPRSLALAALAGVLLALPSGRAAAQGPLAAPSDPKCDATWRALLAAPGGWVVVPPDAGDREYRWIMTVEGYLDVVWIRGDGTRHEASTRYRLVPEPQARSGCALDVAGSGVWRITERDAAGRLVLEQGPVRRVIERRPST